MFSTWNPESKAWNPESNSALDSLTWGKGVVPVPHTEKKNCKKEIEETKHTDMTNGSLKAQWFLNLNHFLI